MKAAGGTTKEAGAAYDLYVSEKRRKRQTMQLEALASEEAASAAATDEEMPIPDRRGKNKKRTRRKHKTEAEELEDSEERRSMKRSDRRTDSLKLKAKRASKAEEYDSPRRDGPRATPAWKLCGGAPSRPAACLLNVCGARLSASRARICWPLQKGGSRPPRSSRGRASRFLVAG